MRRLILYVSFLFIFTAFGSEQKPVYKDPGAGVDARVADLLAQMTIEEKVQLLGGTGFGTPANTRLGIPELKMTDGPLGVRWFRSTAYGSGIGMAASFDRDLVRRVTNGMGEEVRAKGRDMLLGPCVGISRVPFGGRNFEGMGEDPFLTSEIAASYINGLHDQKVVGSVKHFALNDQEYNRMTINSVADERTMNEIHFPAFKRAVEENIGTVMMSYNLVNGKHSTENPDLINQLKKTWNFKNVVISDWDATHSTVEAAMAGLDLEMPYPQFYGDELLKAVQAKQVPVSVIDDKVSRVLRIIFTAGLFDGAGASRPDPSTINSPEHQKLALELAQASHVLLKNTNNILPFDLKTVKKIAMIGPNAGTLRSGGGGSSMVDPNYTISPLQGMINRIGPAAQVSYARGVALPDDLGSVDEIKPLDPKDGEYGFVGEYFDNRDLTGTPKVRRIDPTIDYSWDTSTAPDPLVPNLNFSARWTGQFKAAVTGDYEFKTRADDGIRVYLNDKMIINDWLEHGPNDTSVTVPIVAGKTYQIKVEYFQATGNSEVRFGWTAPAPALLKQAVDLASKSDVVVMNLGFANWLESEAEDRATFALPDGQDDLIDAVLKVNPHVVVVINSGNPVDMNRWVGKVPAILYAWYPGEEGGDALADILLGNINPSGRLPVTMLKRWEDSPAYGSYPENNGDAVYKEGIYVGYRYYDKMSMAPQFPFGHGLSYTTFHYDGFQIHAVNDDAQNPNFEADITVTNTGAKSGAEVVQLYVHDQAPKIDRPVQELKGFQKVFLQPGESRTLKFLLDKSSFAFYDVTIHDWKTAPGAFSIRFGSSSRDIRVMGDIELTAKTEKTAGQ
jgi:beta-glucosidase